MLCAWAGPVVGRGDARVQKDGANPSNEPLEQDWLSPEETIKRKEARGNLPVEFADVSKAAYYIKYSPQP
jgi:hypothetical protein